MLFIKLLSRITLIFLVKENVGTRDSRCDHIVRRNTEALGMALFAVGGAYRNIVIAAVVSGHLRRALGL